VWAHGRLKGERFRRSLGTRSLTEAKKKIQRLLDGTDEALAEPAPDAPTIAAALGDHVTFLRNLRRDRTTIESYEGTFKAFAACCDERRFRTVNQMTNALFEHYMASRTVTPKTLAKEFKHLAGFCSRGMKLGWLETNLARTVELPKTDGVSTMPFREDEAKALLAACARLGEPEAGRGRYDAFSAEHVEDERRYAKALVLLLLGTGLRISDAVNLARNRVFIDRKGATRIRLRTEKTGVLVTLKLSHATAEALKNAPAVSDELYFWKGGDDIRFRTARSRARRMIARLGAIAGVANAHPHRFRDTWAKTALLNGTAMRTVQLVLGHKSIKTTELHYAQFVPEYQQLLDDATDAVSSRLTA
jgi:integrase